MRRPTHATRRGSTLITVTLLLGTMTVLALVSLRVGQRLRGEQDAGVESTRATLLAEAGISEAIEAVRAGRSGSVADADDPAYLGGGLLWVTATDLGDGRIQLDSMAMRDSGRAALRVVIDGAGGDDAASGDSGDGSGFIGMLFANKQMQLDAGVTIDSYDSSLGTYASQAINTYGATTYANSKGSASSNAQVTVDSNVNVFGDVLTGPGYTPTVAGSAYVSGTKGAISQTIPLADITVPTVAASGVYSVANNATKTINPGTYHFTSCTQGKFSTLKVVGPATIVLDGYTTGASATMELDCTNGPVTIYNTGAWTVDKNYTVKPKTGTPVNAAFLISSTGTVEFKQGSKLYVGFYAPKAKIQVDQGAECWGALVADEIDIDQNTKFHFDENLANFKLPWKVPDAGADASALDPKVISWSKIEFPRHDLGADRRDPFALLGVTKANLRSPSEAWEAAGP